MNHTLIFVLITIGVGRFTILRNNLDYVKSERRWKIEAERV